MRKDRLRGEGKKKTNERRKGEGRRRGNEDSGTREGRRREG